MHKVCKPVSVLVQQIEDGHLQSFTFPFTQGFDCAIANIGEKLGCLVNSQKRQLDLGVRKSVELVQLVKKYYHRWNCLTSSAEKRRTDIEAAMVKYDPANLGVTCKWVW